MAKDNFTNLSYLLGGWAPQSELTGSSMAGNKGWNPDMAVVKAAIDFAISTGRLVKDVD